jgi:hypothetical protein
VDVEAQDRFLVPASRLKAAKIVGIGALFVVMAAWFFDRPETGCLVIGAASAGLGALFGGYGFYRMVRPGIAVLVDHEGVLDRASATGVGRIRWDEIETVRVYGYMGQSTVGIVPRNPEDFLSRQPAWRRWLLRANLGLGGAPVNIPDVILPISANELLAAMERYAGRTWLT